MKKVYTFIAATFVGSMIGASASVPMQAPIKSLEQTPIRQASELLSSEIQAPSQINKLQPAFASRSEEFDPTIFTQQIYYDYFFNRYDSDGKTPLDSFRYLQSSNEVELDFNEEEMTLTINNFCAYSDFSPVVINITENGELEMELGQVLYEDSKRNYTFVLASIDNNNNIQISGSITWDLYTNAIVWDGYLGAYVFDSTSGKGLGWASLSAYILFIQPNALLEYSFENVDSETGTVETVNVENYVYIEEREAEQVDPEHPWPSIWISNIMPWNEGIGVKFYYDTDMVEDGFVAVDQIAYPSQMIDDYNYTGDFYLSYINSQYYVPGIVLADELTEVEGITWPANNEDLGVEATGWLVINDDSGYAFPEYGPATLTIGLEEAGINDIVTDNSSNEAPVYYNIQGMQVNRPEAGQLYIKKQGNNISKVIIR